MVTNNTSKSRYELTTDGHTSFATYRQERDKVFIDHVFVPEDLRGRGIAAQLMKGVVEDTKQRGLEIVPICPYAVSYLKRHK